MSTDQASPDVGRLIEKRNALASAIREYRGGYPARMDDIDNALAALDIEIVHVRGALAALQGGERPQSESIRVAHARKQGGADGFQQGWHAALARVIQGDSVNDLVSLVPDERNREHDALILVESLRHEKAQLTHQVQLAKRWAERIMDDLSEERTLSELFEAIELDLNAEHERAEQAEQTVLALQAEHADIKQQLEVLKPGGTYAWKSKYEALEQTVQRLTEEQKTAMDLLTEIAASHRDKDSVDYNECETAPCAFCDTIAALASPSETPRQEG